MNQAMAVAACMKPSDKAVAAPEAFTSPSMLVRPKTRPAQAANRAKPGRFRDTSQVTAPAAANATTVAATTATQVIG